MAKIYVFSPNEEQNDYSTMGLVCTLQPTECTFKEASNGDSSIQLLHPLDEVGRFRALERGNILQIPVPVRTTPEIQNGSVVTTVWTYKVKNLDVLTHKNQRTLFKKSTGSGAMKILEPNETVTVVEKPAGDNVRWKVKTDYGTGWMMQDGLDLVTAHEIEDNSNSIEEVQSPWTVKPQLFRIYDVTKTIDSVQVSARHISYDLLYNITDYKSAETVALQTALTGVLEGCDKEHPFEAFTNVANEQAGLDYADKNPIEAMLDPEEGICKRFEVGLVRDNYELFFLHDPGLNRGVIIRYGKNMLGVEYEESDDEVVTSIIPVGENKDGSPLYLEDGIGTWTVTLSRGDRGTDVRTMQSLLVKAGYSVGSTGVDGIFGSRTEAGVRAFQTAAGLTVDGVFTPTVYNALMTVLGIVGTGRSIDSPKASDSQEQGVEKYPIPHVYVLKCENCKVGDKDDGGGTVTVEIARARMREQALKMLEENCDEPNVKMKVEFQNLGDTEEYAQFRNLENCFLFDYIVVQHQKHNLNVTARIVGIEWDVLAEKMKSVEIGQVGKTLANSGVTTWQIPSGFSGSKIAGGTVGAGQLGDEVINARHIQSQTINAQHIVSGTITANELNANSVNAMTIAAVTAKIQEIASEHITTDELYAGLAIIAVATVEEATIDWASIRDLTAEIASIGKAQITTANIIEANIAWADVESLAAHIANIANARIADATIMTAQIADLQAEIATVITLAAQQGRFEFAKVKDLLASAMILEEGVAGTVYIKNLIATHANFVGAIIGDLVLQGDDGLYYDVSIQADGTIYTAQREVSDEELIDGITTDGKQIVATTANIADLNAETIRADSAIISDIFTQALVAGKVSASEAFLASATIPELYTTAIRAVGDSLDLSANESIRLIVRDAIDIGATNLIRINDPDHPAAIQNGTIDKDADDAPYRRSLTEFQVANQASNYVVFPSPIKVHGSQDLHEKYTLSFWAWATSSAYENLIETFEINLSDMNLYGTRQTAFIGPTFSLANDTSLIATYPDDYVGPSYIVDEDGEIEVDLSNVLKCVLVDQNGIEHEICKGGVGLPNSPFKTERTFEIDFTDAVYLKIYSYNLAWSLSDVKLERGSVATDWSANQYDLESYTDAQITILQGQIDLKASQQALNNLTGVVQSNTAAIQLVPGEIKAAVQSVAIGATNLYHGTKKFDGPDWYVLDGYWTIDTTPANAFEDYTVLTKTGPWNYPVQHIRVEAGHYYTYSCWIRAYENDVGIRSYFTDATGDWCEVDEEYAGNKTGDKSIGTIGNGWVRKSFTVLVTKSGLAKPGIQVWVSGKTWSICGIKFERGNKATDWSAAPSELYAGTTVKITDQEFSVSTQVFDVDIQNESEHFTLDENGGTMNNLTVNRQIVAPNIAYRYTGGNVKIGSGSGMDYKSLNAFFKQVNNTILSYDLTITLYNDIYEDVTIGGMSGIGQLVINGQGHKIIGTITLRNVGIYLRFNQITVDGTINASDVGYIKLQNSTINSPATATCLSVSRGANIELDSCTIVNTPATGQSRAWSLIYMETGAILTANNVKGGHESQNFISAFNSVITWRGYRPLGWKEIVACLTMPTNLSDLEGQDAEGYTPQPPTVTTTTTFQCIKSRTSYDLTAPKWYGSSNGVPKERLRQGFADNNGQYGCFWFDTSGLSGATILSATLTLTRVSGYGRAGEVSVGLYTTPYNYPDSDDGWGNPHTDSVDRGILGTIANGETKTFVIPTAAISANAKMGLMLKVADDSNIAGRGYSTNYSHFYGYGEGTAPVLTVTYR